MKIDRRGGSNKKSLNETFFKKWSPNMSYVLGYLSADGAVEDVRKSSRTCYITVTSIDKDLILNVKEVLQSKHNIYEKSEHIDKFGEDSFRCKKSFILRIGSKMMFQDLVNLGLTPRKSLRLKLPDIPRKLFRFYLRGYFDGDGCTHVSIQKGRIKPEITTIFTSGCEQFLKSLSLKICERTGISPNKIYFNSGAFRLKYRKTDSLKLLSYIYRGLKNSIYLKRKYKIYQNYLTTLN